MSYNKILTEEKDNTVKITLNRPEKRNSLDEEMISELTDAFGKFSDDKNTRALFLRDREVTFAPDFIWIIFRRSPNTTFWKTKPTRRNSEICFSPFTTAASRS